MDIAIYCSTIEQKAATDDLVARTASLSIKVDAVAVTDTAAGGQELPLTLLQVMALKGADTFPLTLVNNHAAVSGRLPDVADLQKWATEGLHESVALITDTVSAIDFEGRSRIHISLDVTDIETALPFYLVLFGARPTKRCDDYVKFELDEPRINLTLNQHAESHASSGHYGIQVKSSTTVAETSQRLRDAGFAITQEEETACCYAVQSKVWVVDPDGNRWEVFVVTQAEADEGCGPDCVCYQDLERSFVSSTAAATATAR